MSQEKGTKRIITRDKFRVYNQCSRKKGYATTKSANNDIHNAFKKTGVKLSYYKCDICGKYHLTKKFVKNKF